MADPIEVKLPELGETIHEGTIAKWLVQPGGRVEEFEPLVEVETDKVATEIPSPVSGTLRQILAQEGTLVPSGQAIALVDPDGAEHPVGPGGTGGIAATPATAAQPATAPAPGMPQIKPGQDSPAVPTLQPGPTTPPAAPSPPAADNPETGDRLPTGEHRFSPAVRLLAEEKGVDLAAITGTGLGGRVTKKDVESAGVKPTAASAPSAAPAAPAAPMTGDEKIPLTRIRRLIAENMTRSKSTIPHAWQTQEVDMSGVVASRNRAKGAFQREEGYSLTFLPYIVKAATVALREHPAVNSTFNGDHILQHRDVNVGISVGLEDSLVVPVLRGADSLSLAGIARAINDVATRARNGKLKGDDLQGGTFTVNNSGTFGTLFSYSVIAPGQAGILTMEAIVERPVAVQGMIAVKPMMYLCFSFDHRVLDGLQAARFLVSCRRWLESVTAETPIY